jgi:hypothetical protein
MPVGKSRRQEAGAGGRSRRQEQEAGAGGRSRRIGFQVSGFKFQVSKAFRFHF